MKRDEDGFIISMETEAVLSQAMALADANIERAIDRADTLLHARSLEPEMYPELQAALVQAWATSVQSAILAELVSLESQVN